MSERQVASVDAPPPSTSSTLPDVSVVVPTYRRPAMLATCLRALAAQQLDCMRYEIVVCDDGPDDHATRACVDRFAAQHAPHGLTVRYVPVTATQGPAAARNAGWRVARAPLVAFTDDDCIPDAGWLSAGLSAMASGAVGASGKIVVPIGDPPTDYERAIKGLEQAPFATASCFYLRLALVTTGGFDEQYRAAWREDSDLEFRMARLGGLVSARDALVVHPVRTARVGVSLAEQRKAMYNALLYRGFPGEYRRYIQSRPPLGYYGACVGALLALAGLLAGSGTAVLIGVMSWALCVGMFMQRRLRGISHKPGHVAEIILTSLAIPPLAVFWRLRGAFRFRVLFA
jgi:GT2 family glycosyltransferase